jgi:hypothetical protein
VALASGHTADDQPDDDDQTRDPHVSLQRRFSSR